MEYAKNELAIKQQQQNQQWFAVNLHDITFTTLIEHQLIALLRLLLCFTHTSTQAHTRVVRVRAKWR